MPVWAEISSHLKPPAVHPQLSTIKTKLLFAPANPVFRKSEVLIDGC